MTRISFSACRARTLGCCAKRASVLLLLAAVGWGCCASAAQRMRTSTTEQPADAEVLLLDQSYTLKVDGSRLQRVEQVSRIHTDYAIDRLGDPRLVHNVATQKLKILKADTTMRDGKVVSIKPNSINETTPDALVATPAYTDLRETVVTHVGMEVGCTNTLAYEIREQATQAPLWAAVPLHQPYPVKQRVVRVTVPRDAPLRWACLGCSVQPTENATADGPELRFVWEALVPMNTDEAGHGNRPPIFNQPRLVFSTAPSWKSLSKDLLTRFRTAAFADDRVKARAKALVADLATDEQRALAVWRFVARDLSSVHWPLDDFGFTMARAGDVLERSYGHTLDKAVLMVALLAAVEIEARPVLLSADALFAEQVPSLVQFGDVWVVAHYDGHDHWMSPIGVEAGAGHALHDGLYRLDLEKGTPEPIKACNKAVARNQSDLVAQLSAVDGAVTGTFELALGGSYNPYLEVDADHAVDGVMGGLLGATGAYDSACEGCFQRVRKLAPGGSSFSFKAQGKSGGTEQILDVALPWTPRSQLLEADLHRARRETSMALRSPGTERVVVKLAIPKGYELRSKLPQGKVSNAVGSLLTESRREDGEVVVERTLTLTKRIIAPEDYPALRELFTELHRSDARSLLFAKKEEKPAA